MFQKFHTNSLFTQFVKQLVETEYIPTLQCVQNGSPVIAGCSYLYGDDIVHSKVTGKFNSDDSKSYSVSTVKCTTSNFHSPVSWYDSETHKQLGNYLRYLRDYHDLDLMPYYNCYSGIELNDIYLEDFKSNPLTVKSETADKPLFVSETVKVGSSVSYKLNTSYTIGNIATHRVVAIPIKYDTEYTIALSCPSEVLLRGVVYNSGNVSIDNRDSHNSKTYYSDYLNQTFVRMRTCYFNRPFTYRIPLVDQIYEQDPILNDRVKRELYDRQDDLYLLIQLPVNTQTSIVVIEGNVNPVNTVHNQNYINKYGSREAPQFNNAYQVSDRKLLSLLQYNTGISYAFSDRLIEYLLCSCVSELETLPSNIKRIQESLCKLYPEYHDRFFRKTSIRGMWDDSLPTMVKRAYKDNPSALPNKFDQDGRINKDVEMLLSNKGVYKT